MSVKEQMLESLADLIRKHSDPRNVECVEVKEDQVWVHWTEEMAPDYFFFNDGVLHNVDFDYFQGDKSRERKGPEAVSFLRQNYGVHLKLSDL